MDARFTLPQKKRISHKHDFIARSRKVERRYGIYIYIYDRKYDTTLISLILIYIVEIIIKSNTERKPSGRQH